MLAYITRHGQTEYRQGKVKLAEADDLTTEGRDNVIMSALDAASNMESLGIKNTEIKSSPYGRTLYAAKIWQKALRMRNIGARDIEICPGLSEIENLNYSGFLLKFIIGGDIQCSDGEFTIDPKESNPEKYPSYVYFRMDAWHKLSPDYRRKLPKEITEKIDATETFVQATKRFKGVLDSLDSKFSSHLLVCHEGYTGEFIEILAGGRNMAPYLDRGKYFVLEKRDNLWVPFSIQNNGIKFDR